MYKVSLLVLLLSASIVYGQTKAIAFKSHSGNSTYYSSDGDGNFGLMEPMPSLDSIAKINDSTTIHYTNRGYRQYFYDTLINHPFWCQTNLNIDSLKKEYPYNNVKFIGFKAKRVKSKNLHAVKSVHSKRKTKALIVTRLTKDAMTRRIKVIERMHAHLD